MTTELDVMHERQLRLTRVSTDDGDFVVSTVALTGIGDNVFMSLAALFCGTATEGYETMVFIREDWENPQRVGLRDLYARKYADEKKARMGHQQVVDEILSGKILLRAHREEIYDSRREG